MYCPLKHEVFQSWGTVISIFIKQKKITWKKKKKKKLKMGGGGEIQLTFSSSIPVTPAILSFSGWPSLRKFLDIILLT